MSEPFSEVPTGKYEDREAGARRDFIIETGRQIFAGSALINPQQEIGPEDLARISEYHKAVSPANPNAPWRLEMADRSLESGQIADPTTYANWEAPGGPLESIELATEAAGLIVRELKARLKQKTEVSEDFAATIDQIHAINPYHAQAAAALHDEGRKITHLFFTNEVIARRMLERMGVREDIRSILPDENVMQVPPDESMDAKIQSLDPEAVIVRIADEFGKRKGKTNRTLLPGDFDQATMEAWAQNYLNRPLSGRPSDQWARDHIDVHVANVPRYFKALDHWVKAVSNTDLGIIAQKIQDQLSPTLRPIE